MLNRSSAQFVCAAAVFTLTILASFAVAADIDATATGYWVPKVPPRTHYKIECSIDPAKGLLEGKEVIRFRNTTSRPIHKLAMKWPLYGGRTLEITSNGKAVSFLTSVESSPVAFALAEAIGPGEEVNLESKFSVSAPVPEDVDKFPLTGWYPRLWWGFETHDDFDAKVKVPPEYKIATSGVFDSKTGHYHSEGVRSFGLVLCKNHNVIEASAGDVLVRCLFTPKGEKCARLLLNTAVDVINFYRERFGFYPYSCLTIVPGMDYPTGGYPVATNIVAIHGMEQLDSMPKYHWQWITAHEIGHQYCGEHILSKDPADSFDWLMIGLGIYADREYTQARNLSSAKHQALMARYIKGVRAGLDTTINITPEQRSKIQFDFNNVVEHGKSYSVISALDCVLGKKVFDKIYRRCLKEFGGRRLGVNEFRAVCEQESQQDLGWFFEQWVNSNKYLSYEISSRKCEKKGDRYICEIEVKRLGDLKMPVPVAAHFEDGTSHSKFADRLLDVSVLEFESKSPLKEVQLDPEGELAMVIPPPSASESKLLKELLELPWTGAGSKALEIFKQAKKLKQTDYEAWGKLGLNLYDGKHYAEALEAFRRVVEASEKEPAQRFVSFVALVWQGHMLDIMDRREEALQCYRKALKIDTGFTMRHDPYGMVINRDWVEERLKKPFQRK